MPSKDDLREDLRNLLSELKDAEFRSMQLVDDPPAGTDPDFSARMMGEHTAYRQAAWRLANVIQKYEQENTD